MKNPKYPKIKQHGCNEGAVALFQSIHLHAFDKLQSPQ